MQRAGKEKKVTLQAFPTSSKKKKKSAISKIINVKSVMDKVAFSQPVKPNSCLSVRPMEYPQRVKSETSGVCHFLNKQSFDCSLAAKF